MSRKSLKLFSLSGAAVAALLSASPAFAQEDTLEEIVVTAQRRSEPLQNVPMQVTAFSAETIENAGIGKTSDFISLVPNVSLDESFTYLNSFVVVRGVSQINNADSPVSVIVDGVPQNNQKQLRMNLFDVERIEVLKGPQGGLYGRNAIGGAINIITKAPSDHLEGWVEGQYGSGDARELSAAVSGPISGTAAFRLSGSWKAADGNIDNAYTGEPVDWIDHDAEIRGKLTFKPTEALDIDLRASYRDFEAGAVYDSVVPSGRADDYQPPRENIRGETFGDIFDASAKFDLDLGFATLTGVTAYTDLEENYRGDLDFSNPVDKPGGFLGLGFQAGQGQDLDVKMTSQEFRLVSRDDQAFRWIAGAFYLHADRDLRTRAFIDLDGKTSQIDNPGLVILDIGEENSNDAYALYGQFDWDATEQLTVSGALRYDEDRREQTNVATGVTRRKTFDSVQPKLTVTWKFEPDKLAYATVSTGFRSGGFNGPAVSIPVFKSETLTNYEIGFKTSWLNRRLILNGAAYYAKDEDFQYFFVDVLTASQIIGNIDEVSIRGIELEAQALLAPGLQVYGAIGTTDSEIEKNTLAPATVGNHTPKTTEWSLNAGVQYSRTFAGDWKGLVRLDYEHKGEKFWQLDNADVQEPVDLINLRIAVERGPLALAVSGRNITNEKYFTDFNPKEFSGADLDIGFRAQPAVWAVELKYRY